MDELSRHPRVCLRGDLVGKGPVGGDLDGAVRQHRLDQLVLDEAASELTPRLGPVRRLGERPLGAAEGTGGDHDPLLDKPLPSELVSSPDTAEDGVFTHDHTVEPVAAVHG